MLDFIETLNLESIVNYVISYGSYVFTFFVRDIFFFCILGIVFWCFSKKVAAKVGVAYILGGCICEIISACVHADSPLGPSLSALSAGISAADVMDYSFPSLPLFGFIVLATTLFINYISTFYKVLTVIIGLLVTFSVIIRGGCDIWSAVATLVIAIAISILTHKFIDGTVFDSKQNFTYLLFALIPPAVLILSALALKSNDVIQISRVTYIAERLGIYTAFPIAWFIDQQFVKFIPRCMTSAKTFLKGLLGVLILLAVYFILGFIFPYVGNGWFLTFIQSFITIIAGFGLYPFIIKAYFSPNVRQADHNLN